MQLSAHLVEFPDKKACQINDVRMDIAVRAAAGMLFLKPPQTRHLGINQPALRVAGVVMTNLADGALLNHLLRLRDGGDAAVVVADHMHDLGALHGLQHLAALPHIQRERLFAKHVLARLGRGDGNLGMGIIRRVDVDHVDLRIGHHRPPIVDGMIPAKLRARLFHLDGVATANGVQPHIAFEIKKARRLPPGVAVGLAHESVSDQADF